MEKKNDHLVQELAQTQSSMQQLEKKFMTVEGLSLDIINSAKTNCYLYILSNIIVQNSQLMEAFINAK